MNTGKKTVLIVDDEEIILDIEDLMLKRIGYNTLKARNSAEACQLYNDEKEHIERILQYASQRDIKVDKSKNYLSFDT